MDTTSRVEQHRTTVVALALLAPLAVCATLSLFRDSVTGTTASLLLVLLVVTAASTGIRTAGVLAALSCGLWFDVFLTEPYGRLAIDDRNDIEATVLLVVIGAAVTEIALWGRREQARASRRTGYLDGVLGTAEIVALHDESPAALAEHVAVQIRELLDVTTCRFVAGEATDSRLAVLHHDGLVTRGGRPLAVERDGLPTDDQTALLVTRAGTTLGHFVLTSAGHVARPTLEERRVAILLADQMAAALASPGGGR